MTKQEVIDVIKLNLTGGRLKLEITDDYLGLVIDQALRELNRYWDETSLITVPFCSCIDLKDFNSSSVVNVYRTESHGDASISQGLADPMFAQQWMLFSNGGTMYNLNDYVLNYAAWNTMMQIKNTLSTDLSFKEDKHNNKLYINQYMSRPSRITIEYIPKLKKVEDIQSDYWIDILLKLSLGMTKQIVGAMRTKYAANGAPWALNGDKILEEGNTEVKELREKLSSNANMTYVLD